MEDCELKVFISQPIKDKSYEQVENERQVIIDRVKEYFKTNNLQFVKSHFSNDDFEISAQNHSLYLLAKCLEILSDCDIIVMATGWENARGCRIEYECARLYGIMVIFEDTKYIVDEKQFEVDRDPVTSD